jgi:putative endonuclease
MTAQTRAIAEARGRRAETICVVILRLTGWRILAQRMTARRGTGLGEIDIVAKRGATLAFIEVKARGDAEAAAESVTVQQRARIAWAADVFLQQRPNLASCNVRFDVMAFGRGWWPRRLVDAWRP